MIKWDQVYCPPCRRHRDSQVFRYRKSLLGPRPHASAPDEYGTLGAGDQSKDKGRFAEGNALMQDLSSAGKAVLPSSVPDSGTPFRAAAMYAMAHPLKAGLAAVPIGAASLAYTPMGQGVLQRLIEAQQQPAARSPLLKSGILQAIQVVLDPGVQVVPITLALVRETEHRLDRELLVRFLWPACPGHKCRRRPGLLDQ